MPYYYVNKISQSNGDHEVHKEDCRYFPESNIYLGYHLNCQTAIREAQKYYPTADGCNFCANECHTS